MPAIETIRANIQAQGFCGLDDETYRQIDLPLRLAPAICMTWVAVGSAMGSPLVLGALLPFAFLGALLPGHPFDVIYNHGIRHLTGGPRLPRYTARRRFTCAMGTVMIATAAGLMLTGNPLAGSLVGWSLAAAAFVNVSTGFCIPGFLAKLTLGPVDCSGARTTETSYGHS